MYPSLFATFLQLLKRKESADDKISRFYIHASFNSSKSLETDTVVHDKVIFHQF